eukprot:XP_001690593.1 hexose-phosphate transporter [Chlamydomonas reinhardtii]
MQPMQAQGWRHWRGSAGKGPARACTGCATITSTVLPPCLRVWARGQTSRRLALARFFREGRETVGPPGQPGPGTHTAAQAKAGAQEPPGFQPRRLLVFSCLVLGYAGYYLTRNSLTYTAPVMVADPSLGFSLAQVGTMTSIFPIAYGLSKFVSGIVGDRYSPSLLLGGGLIATAACNLAFGAAGSLHVFAAMWALNGLMQPPGVLRAALDNVLSNPAVWALAFVYFFVYVVRQGVTSWSMFYLMREKGVADAAQAAARVSGLELGGLVGGLAAGRLSDILIRRSAASGQGSVGVRVKVVMAYTAGLAASLLLFQSLPPGTAPLLQWLSVAAIGFCIYGPQMLVGLCGAELVHPASVGASQGVLGWIAYLGAANAGVPLSLIIERYGWSAYFATLLGACGLALALLAPLLAVSLLHLSFRCCCCLIELFDVP